METCILFICWTTLGPGDFVQPGTSFWQADGWEIVHVIRNDDSTDMGCRLVRTSELGGRMELDAYFLAGNVTFVFTQDVPIQGQLDVGIYGKYGAEYWGGDLSSGRSEGTLIKADIPGAGIIDLLQEWTERGVTEVSLVDSKKNQIIATIAVPDLPAATAAFMECQDAMPW